MVMALSQKLCNKVRSSAGFVRAMTRASWRHSARNISTASPTRMSSVRMYKTAWRRSIRRIKPSLFHRGSRNITTSPKRRFSPLSSTFVLRRVDPRANSSNKWVSSQIVLSAFGFSALSLPSETPSGFHPDSHGDISIEILDGDFYIPSKHRNFRGHHHLRDWESKLVISGFAVSSNTELKDEYTMRYKDLLDLPTVARDVYMEGVVHPRIKWGKNGTLQSNGTDNYRGVLFRDLMKHIGVDIYALMKRDRNLYVWFIGADCGSEGERSIVSVPAHQALSQRGDVLLAFECNEKVLAPDHGFPVTVLLPGSIGARSVECIENIVIANKEFDVESLKRRNE